MLCCKNSETNSNWFCTLRWLGSYGISFSPCLGFCGFAQLLWTLSYLLDTVSLGGIKKKNALREVARLAVLMVFMVGKEC